MRSSGSGVGRRRPVWPSTAPGLPRRRLDTRAWRRPGSRRRACAGRWRGRADLGELLGGGEDEGGHRIASELVHPIGLRLADLAAQRGVDDRAELVPNRGVHAQADRNTPSSPMAQVGFCKGNGAARG